MRRPSDPTRNRPIAIGVALATALLMLAMAAPVTAASGEWHRNNYGGGHEILTCSEGLTRWTCKYVSIEITDPNGSTAYGTFTGRDVTRTWVCPAWFPESICLNVVAVYSGTAIYWGIDNNHRSVVTEDYVVTDVGGQAILQQYWHRGPFGPMVCPWYRTWAEALAADYNCTFQYPPG